MPRYSTDAENSSTEYMDTGYWIKKKKKKTIMIPRVSLFVSSIIIFSPSSRGVMSTRRNAFAW